MGLIIEHCLYKIISFSGFQFKCPNGFLFSQRDSKCHLEADVGECLIFSDPTQGVEEIVPVVELEKDKLDQFFESNSYWDFMEFLPTEPQRVIRRPSEFTRESSFSFRNK